MKISLRSALVAAAVAAPLPTIAADANGDFAVRGAGRIACAELQDALQAKDQQRLTIFATWIDGYVTALSQTGEDTFDAAPWMTTELLLALAGQSCANRPDADVMAVVGRLMAELRPIRLAERSPLLKIDEGDAATVLYRETVERARARLEALGYGFETEGVVGRAAHEELRKNLLAYQEASGLPPSGRLDQHTLLNLFVRPAP